MVDAFARHLSPPRRRCLGCLYGAYATEKRFRDHVDVLQRFAALNMYQILWVNRRLRTDALVKIARSEPFCDTRVLNLYPQARGSALVESSNLPKGDNVP